MSDPAVRCVDCRRVTPRSQLSTSGPIKEIDEDGNLSRRWFHVCPWCFGAALVPVAEIEAGEIDADQVNNFEKSGG